MAVMVAAVETPVLAVLAEPAVTAAR